MYVYISDSNIRNMMVKENYVRLALQVESQLKNK